LLPSRLALRIYLVGLAQIAVVAAGFVAFVELNRPGRRGPPEAEERRTVENVTVLLERGEPLQQELERARDAINADITVSDPDGRLLATTSPDMPGCGPQPRRPRRPHVGPPPGICRIAALRFPDGDYGRIEFRPKRPPPPPSPFELPVIAFVLVVVGVSSWLLARSLVRPLQKLSDAARALGEGRLEARAAVERRDELGDVAKAFDEMAERVTELLHAEKELVANVSHELRTPLARIRVALDLAREGDAEVVRASIADIADDLEELEGLVSDVLAAARLDLDAPRGIPPLRREHLDVAQLLEHAASRFRTAHPDRPLQVELSDDLPTIDGDPVLLRRVVDNLLDNAHKYTEDPALPIELRAHGALVIEVIDKGIGIAAPDLKSVFRPFFRADRSRTRETGGLGLGLALAKRIVEAHGGTIALESVANQGTTARIELPIAR